jgi:hypothetical protein
MAFDQVTLGPSGTSGGNQNAPGITLDQQNNIAATIGQSRTESVLQTALAVIQAQTALTNITTAQNLFSKALNAWLLNRVGRTLLITAQLIYTSPGTTTPTITIALTLGGVTLCTITTAAISSTASTNMPVYVQFYATVVTTGATATLEVHGQVTANISANTPAAAAATYVDTNTAVSSAVNVTTALTLLLTIAASSALTSAQLRFATIEVVS